jgi:hypothetical protein
MPEDLNLKKSCICNYSTLDLEVMKLQCFRSLMKVWACGLEVGWEVMKETSLFTLQTFIHRAVLEGHNKY